MRTSGDGTRERLREIGTRIDATRSAVLSV
jgi:hypothetical protein